MSNAGEALVQPSGDFGVTDATEVTVSGDLQNDDAVVVIDSADVAKAVYYLPGGPWCLNDPKRKERPTPINRGSQRREDAVLGFNRVVRAEIVADNVPRHGFLLSGDAPGA